MTTYCVSYDLNKSDKNYDGLISAIQQYNCTKALCSTWFIKSNSSAQTIYDNLKEFIDSNDHLFVIEVNTSNEQGWMPKAVWNWLDN